MNQAFLFKKENRKEEEKYFLFKEKN